MTARITIAAAILTAGFAATATAQEIKVGITAAFTGPQAAIGAPYKQTADIFPDKLAGIPVKWITLDDAGDVATSVKNTKRFIEEEKVDVVMGTSSAAGIAAMMEITFENKTPHLTLAPAAITEQKRPWAFNVPQAVPLIVSGVIEDIKKKGYKQIGFIGFADVFGDLVFAALKQQSTVVGFTIISDERFNRNDTSATAQALKVMSGNPDAVVIGAAATPSTLPQIALRDQGYTKQIYQMHGSVSRPVLQAGGKMMEGTLAPTGPIMVAADLPDSNPIKKVSLDLIEKFEAKYGKGTTSPFSGYAWDCMLILQAAVPDAIKKGKPGTPEFRAALRDSIQSGREVVGTNGVYKYTETDHYGLDERARVLVIVKDGAWRLAQ
jgi:branched-chain amino acid transport system substrate-binding protein